MCAILDKDRPSLPLGIYFRRMMIGFFAGIESERGIAWRVADSVCLRPFLQIGLDKRTRRLMVEATHQEALAGC
jgi:transposase